jgi:pyruvate kinase
MTKILTTIGPASDGKNLKYFINNSDFIRFNMAHNAISWHKKNIDQVKKINPNKLVLVDIPGVKLRTLNKKSIFIKKGEKVKFSYKVLKKENNVILLSNPLPKIKKKSKFFYLSDGIFEFKNLNIKNRILTGISCQNFTLNPKKGLNIPFSIYNDKIQEKLYFLFLKKISRLNIDCVGLSFIQNSNILKKLKKKYPKLIFISKIENYLGYKNRKDIIQNSDAIMIDRGDLAAEVGISKLSEYTNNIIIDTKNIGKSVIIATENLNSLIYNEIPTKSEVMNIDYYLQKNVDYLMLSDETTTSTNSKNTIRWLNNYLKKKKSKKTQTNLLKIEEIIKSFKDQTLIVFTKKGYFYNKISSYEFKNLVLFTENVKLKKVLQLKRNSNSILIKFPKKYLYSFLYENIKRYKEVVFKDNKFAYLINVIFPREHSRANTISIIQEKDFL